MAPGWHNSCHAPQGAPGCCFPVKAMQPWQVLLLSSWRYHKGLVFLLFLILFCRETEKHSSSCTAWGSLGLCTHQAGLGTQHFPPPSPSPTLHPMLQPATMRSLSHVIRKNHFFLHF